MITQSQPNKTVSKDEINRLAQSCLSVSQREISRENNNSIEQSELCCPLPNSKDNPPRLQVSIDFAVSQWFQILLIHINSRNKKLSGVLEPIGECQLSLNA